jgi:hypothetical protein
LALSGLLLSAVGLPTTRVFENVVPNPNPPPAGTPYVVEQNVPATSEVLSATMKAGAPRFNDGMYVAQYFGVDGSGISGIGDAVDAILAVFPPGKSIPLPSGDTLRIKGKPAPAAGGITPLTGGFAFVTVQVPWWTLSALA